MRALRLTEWKSDPVATEVPVPEPQGPEVLVEVAAAGLCRTDLHIMSSPPGAYPYTLPFTLGHESAGRVAALGPEASGVDVGDPVVVYSRWGCGTCWQCASGRDNACVPTAALTAGGSGVTADWPSICSFRRLDTWCLRRVSILCGPLRSPMQRSPRTTR